MLSQLVFEWFGALGLWLGAIIGFFSFLLLLRCLLFFPRVYAEIRMYYEQERKEEFWAELSIQGTFGLIAIIGTVLFLPSVFSLFKYIFGILNYVKGIEYH